MHKRYTYIKIILIGKDEYFNNLPEYEGYDTLAQAKKNAPISDCKLAIVDNFNLNKKYIKL